MSTVWIYVDTSKDVGDRDHLKVFADEAAAEAWFTDHDPEGSRSSIQSRAHAQKIALWEPEIIGLIIWQVLGATPRALTSLASIHPPAKSPCRLPRPAGVLYFTHSGARQSRNSPRGARYRTEIVRHEHGPKNRN
jgi:hypothetical protein